MLEEFRRVVGGSEDGSSRWDINLGLDAEDTEESLPEDNALENQDEGQNFYDPTKETDFYSSLVRASIAAGGKHAGQKISINWLRMILAGLEGRDASIDLMLFDPRYEQHEPGDLAPAPFAEVFPAR